MFAHISDSVIDLHIEDQDKPIGCTANHPFWSVDRQEFVEAGQLREGERLLLFNGETKRVIQNLPRPGPETVYNLEVFGEHVYLVTADGVLVHNYCVTGRTKSGMNRVSKEWRAKNGPALMRKHHLIPQEMLGNKKFMRSLIPHLKTKEAPCHMYIDKSLLLQTSNILTLCIIVMVMIGIKNLMTGLMLTRNLH
ncbi:MAG: polymorphic toxin-type HINT domain-containing protein [Planctomycetia bacterium]|nr:polymorphic toxin-type HINT domain-containing protein [Planctomycetia bacterium]